MPPHDFQQKINNFLPTFTTLLSTFLLLFLIFNTFYHLPHFFFILPTLTTFHYILPTLTTSNQRLYYFHQLLPLYKFFINFLSPLNQLLTFSINFYTSINQLKVVLFLFFFIFWNVANPSHCWMPCYRCWFFAYLFFAYLMLLISITSSHKPNINRSLGDHCQNY